MLIKWTGATGRPNGVSGIVKESLCGYAQPLRVRLGIALVKYQRYAGRAGVGPTLRQKGEQPTIEQKSGGR